MYVLLLILTTHCPAIHSANTPAAHASFRASSQGLMGSRPTAVHASWPRQEYPGLRAGRTNCAELMGMMRFGSYPPKAATFPAKSNQVVLPLFVPWYTPHGASLSARSFICFARSRLQVGCPYWSLTTVTISRVLHAFRMLFTKLLPYCP